MGFAGCVAPGVLASCVAFVCNAALVVAVAGHGARQGTAHILEDELLDRFIVVPEHKLLFCYIEKVGCKNFNILFRNLRSLYEPSMLTGMDFHRNAPANHNLTREDLERMLLDRSWHKAVFYREPAERFASAYASKCRHKDPDGSQHCKRQFGSKKLPFPQAVGYLKDIDANQSKDETSFDVHFKHQGRFCGGLAHTIQYYDTVEKLDRNSAHEKVSMLLRRVGADPDRVTNFTMLFPPQEDSSWKDNAHNTGTIEALESFYPTSDPSLADIVVQHYAEDYQLFQLSPHFASSSQPPMPRKVRRLRSQ